MAERGFWLLVTGTGRCGTGYVSRVLTSAGVKCTHEGLFNRDEPEETLRRILERQANAWWGWEAGSSWMAAPHLNRPELAGVTVIHLVRHPKKVIDSQMRIRAFSNDDDPFYRWQLHWLPELAGMLPTEKAAYFYVHWNAIIEPHADIFWRVEDDVRGLLDRLGIAHAGRELFADTQYNSRGGYGPSDVDLDALPEPLRGELREMTERYNYEWPDH